PRTAEIGATLSRTYQGKGYASEALAGIFDYMFGSMGIHRVIGVSDAKNLASLKLMERMGMRKEGHFIKNIWFKGQWGDECLCALLKEEWPAK
ncbi:MAG: GNAT family N-acetyltransferase, partial [bacterium]|nr:GNAT family N-acetyltransferase [bacterium]